MLSGLTSRMIIKGSDLLLRTIMTADGRSRANLGSSTRIHAQGRIVNIRGHREAITIGSHCIVRGEILTFKHAGQIRIGDWFYIGPGSTIWSSNEAGIVIGNRVLISMNVHIHDTDSHPLDPFARSQLTREMFTKGHPDQNPGIRSAPIMIGDDVWIGLGATIFKGVKIGHRSIIGARAVVKRDVPEDGFVPTPEQP